ncbi:Solute carrier family 15 member 4-like [Oopsacas minuta]|uniref:Solute carrier family 15 member 4-like n=1 Tax=Oopsacas minuta TaxID=111878 RepID=A0AAV7JQQ4_9METZ|nr:Solute carrier family 15 member 4-like [Oopsacas minuta]
MVDHKNIPLISRVNTQEDENVNKRTLDSKANKVKRIFSTIPIPRDSEKFPQLKLILILVAIQRFALFSVLNFQSDLIKTGLLGKICSRPNWTGQKDSTLTYAGSFLFAPIAGLLADWKFGRHRVFSFGLLMQFIGYSTLGIIFSNQIFNNETNCIVFYVFYYLSLFSIVIGCSSFNTVIIPYGVDQMREASVITTIPSYFHWYYFFINLGSFLAFGSVEQYTDTLVGRLWKISNIYVAIITSFIALLLFKIPSICGWLLPSPPQGNPVGKIYGVVRNAIGNRIEKHNQIDIYQTKRTTLDYAKRSNGGKFTFERVEDVKTFFSMILVLISLSLYFSEEYLFVYFYSLQADGFLYTYRSPAPILISKIGSLTSMIFIVLLEYTTLGRKLYRVLPRILHRFLLGFPLAILSLLFATILEYIHKAPCIAASLHTNATSALPTLTTGHDYLAYLQVIQYILLSLSEVFVTVGSIEWVYAQSPEYLRAFTYGIFESIIGCGTLIPFIVSLFVNFLTCGGIVEEGSSMGVGCPGCWNYNFVCVENRYCYSTEYFFTLLLVASFVSLVIFFLISCWYKPRMRQKIRGFQSFSSANDI